MLIPALLTQYSASRPFHSLKALRVLAVGLLFLGGCAQQTPSETESEAVPVKSAAQWAEEEKLAPTQTIPQLGSTIPAPRQQDYSWMSLKKWYGFHEEDKVIAAKGDVDVLFIGDSITQAWPQDLLDEQFPNHKVANFGIGGDHTQNLLWRLQNGAIGTLEPKLIVQMIGVNNMYDGEYSPQFVFFGVKKVTQQVRKAFPNAKILIAAILPNKEKGSIMGRDYVVRANNMIKTLADNQKTFYRDYGQLFLNEEGKIPVTLMADKLHPSRQGYEKWILPLANDMNMLLSLP